MNILKGIIVSLLILVIPSSEMAIVTLSKSKVNILDERHAYPISQKLGSHGVDFDNMNNYHSESYNGVGRVLNERKVKGKLMNHVGTGFVIDDHTFLTNAHVTSEVDGTMSKSSQITFQPNRDGIKKPNEFHAEKIEQIKGLDLVVVHTHEKMTDKVKPLKIADKSEIKKMKTGDNLHYVGYPRTDYTSNMDRLISRGYFLNTSDLGLGHRGIITKIKVRTGASGSPIINNKGHVVAINSYSYNPKGYNNSPYAKSEISGGIMLEGSVLRNINQKKK